MVKKLPPIMQYSTQVIFWNCELRGEKIFAGLAFFKSNLRNNVVTLSDEKGNKICKAA